jgi:deoxyribonuclease IV
VSAAAAAHLLGAHTSDAGGIHMAARRAGGAGMRALQLFTAIPKFYGEKSSVRPERAERFREALAGTEIEPGHVIAHAAYVLGAATSDQAKWERSRAGLAKELERCSALGIGGACFHPGSSGDGDARAAAQRVGKAITAVLREAEEGPRLLIENTAGAGKTVGRTAEEVGWMLAAVPDELRPRTGYGLDTCHLFSSGYDISGSPEALKGVLDAFEEATGEPPSFLHLNDSEGELGSNRDRHVLLGEGQIGAEPFGWLLSDRRSRGIPIILETPHERTPADDDPQPDAYDVRMLEMLRGMVG